MNKEKIKKILRMNRTIEENALIDFLQDSDKFNYDNYNIGDETLYIEEKEKLIKLNNLIYDLDEDDLIDPSYIYNWFDVEDDSFKINNIINKEKSYIKYLVNLLDVLYIVKNNIGLSIMSNVKMSSMSNLYSADNSDINIEAMDEEYLNKLNQINEMCDNEERHINADILLITALEELGLIKTVERYRRMADGFWYA